jgi:hypothetical protein
VNHKRLAAAAILKREAADEAREAKPKRRRAPAWVHPAHEFRTTAARLDR